MKKMIPNNIIHILLGLILMMAFLLRTYNINWDKDAHLHPDERAIILFTLPISLPESISEFFDPESPLNPNFFAYGNLPLYLLKFSSTIAAPINPELAEYQKLNLLGRAISASIDTITVFLIFRLASVIFRREVGLIAAFLYTFSVFPIQTSHFYTADTILTFFIVLTLYRLIKFHRNPSLANSIILGLSYGLSLATKASALPLVVPILLAIFLVVIAVFKKSTHDFSNIQALYKITKAICKKIIVVGSTSFLAFFIAQPYAIIDFGNFWMQNIQQSQMTHDAYIFPYTLQYVDKIPVIYEVKNIFFWGQGIVISSISVAGLLYISLNFKNFKKDSRNEIVIIFSFFLIFFIIVANFAVGWMRYLLPIYPLLSVAGAAFIFYFVFEKLKHFHFYIRNSVIISLILFILLWPLSFMSIYNKPHPRIEASEWINKNIPERSVIAVEHWDDRLPLFVENQYIFEELTIYELPDDEEKWGFMMEKIRKSHYIILASNRLHDPLQRLSDCSRFEKCYPLTEKYYKNLFSGELGFYKVAEFTSFPTIPLTDIKINDQGADESFTVYDHPRVVIFKNTRL